MHRSEYLEKFFLDHREEWLPLLGDNNVRYFLTNDAFSWEFYDEIWDQITNKVSPLRIRDFFLYNYNIPWQFIVAKFPPRRNESVYLLNIGRSEDKDAICRYVIENNDPAIIKEHLDFVLKFFPLDYIDTLFSKHIMFDEREHDWILIVHNHERLNSRNTLRNLLRNHNITLEYLQSLPRESRDFASEVDIHELSYNKGLSWPETREILEFLGTDEILWLELRTIPNEEAERIFEAYPGNMKALDYWYQFPRENFGAILIKYFGEFLEQDPRLLLRIIRDPGRKNVIPWDLLKDHLDIVNVNILIDNPTVPFAKILELATSGYLDVREILAKRPNLTTRQIDALLQLEEIEEPLRFLAHNKNISEIAIEAFLRRSTKVSEVTKERLSENPNLSVNFFLKYPEIIVWAKLLGNRFTRQFLLEEGGTDAAITEIARSYLGVERLSEGTPSSTPLGTPSSTPLPNLVLDVVSEHSNFLERRNG